MEHHQAIGLDRTAQLCRRPKGLGRRPGRPGHLVRQIRRWRPHLAGDQRQNSFLAVEIGRTASSYIRNGRTGRPQPGQRRLAMRYLLMIYTDETVEANMSPEEQGTYMAAYNA